jgi:predicted glycoside hydrolase/deacetylase ChbG (UPF0249 family)
MSAPVEPAVIVTADDYGYAPGYDRGILEAARSGVIDSVSSFAAAPDQVDPEPLLETGIEVGLHLDFASGDDADVELKRQLEAFEDLYGCPPAYLDGHRHVHAERPFAALVAGIARDRRLPLRSIDARHRRTLLCMGISTPDRLVGRLAEGDPALPAEIAAIAAGRPAPDGVTEWMVHPGYADPGSGSSYDAGREEDLRLVLELGGGSALRAVRRTHAQALLAT